MTAGTTVCTYFYILFPFFDCKLFFSLETKPPTQPLFSYLSQEKYEENGWSIYKPLEEFRRQVSEHLVSYTSSFEERYNI